MPQPTFARGLKMTSKIIATPAFLASPRTLKQPKLQVLRAHTQRGVTLLELMVGIVIGLLVVAVAMSALMVSRGISGTVSDASSIQQQAAYAMRVIGQQLRQAGSIRLNLDPGLVVTESAYLAPVAFESKAVASGTNLSFDPTTDTLTGTATPVALTAGYRRYAEPVFINTAVQSLSRNCLGSDASNDEILRSTFTLDGKELKCAGNAAAAQAIVQNVANFQVRYLLQDNSPSAHPPSCALMPPVWAPIGHRYKRSRSA